MSQSNYSQYVVTAPIREVGADMKVKGITLPTRTYMSNKLVPGCNTYIEVSWIYEMPQPSLVIPAHHAHPFNEITVAMKVLATVMTSSPGPRPQAIKASCNASVPEPTAMP